MFLGEHQHSLDTKGRVILPARHRDQLEGGAVVTFQVDGCLAVYAPDAFEGMAADVTEAAKRNQRGRDVARAFFANAQNVTPDRQGRVAIPQGLRDLAGLSRDVTVAGMYDHIEIWDAARWSSHKQAGERELAEGQTEREEG